MGEEGAETPRRPCLLGEGSEDKLCLPRWAEEKGGTGDREAIPSALLINLLLIKKYYQLIVTDSIDMN